MAPKAKSRLVDQPPSASSSEEQQEQVEESQEEEQSEEEEEEESGEETEEDQPKTVEKKATTQKPVQTPQKPQSSSEPGTENGSGSESEAEAESGRSQPSPSASDFTVKPSLPAKTAPSKPPAKRPQETQQTPKEKESRKKKPKIAEEEEKKAAAIPRSLWSDEDQVALLKGIVEYKAQKGTEPNADMSAFHEYIKGKLQADVSKSQLSDKLRRLKKKFLTNVKDGEDPVFPKGQDYLVFMHSKKIWGAPVIGKADGGTSNGVKENVNNSTNGKAKKNVAVKKNDEPKKSAKGSSFTKTKDDEKHKEEEKEKEKQVAVKEIVKEGIVKGGDQQNFQSRYPRLAASFESMGGMSALYPNATSYLKENMSLIASDKAKLLEEKLKKLQDDEAALMAKRLDLIAEHYRLVVDANKGN
ncbi:unnamed protein product [Withania somnifera]